jgi:iron complex transport system permease protein
VGFALSLSGAIIQGIFRNPLSDPYILGIASGASAGVSMIIMLGLLAIPLALATGAFCGGIVAVFLVYTISQTEFGQLSPYILILAGVAVAAFFSAITTFVMFISKEGELRQVVFWILGSLSVATWPSLLGLSLVILVGAMCAMALRYDLNAMALGDEMAMHLGIDPNVSKKILLCVATLLTASVVSVSGTIGFVGLIVPHIMRLLVGPDHRLLLPTSALAGASFLIFCDILARTLAKPTELPIGIITSLLGAPFFLYLLRFYKKQHGRFT